LIVVFAAWVVDDELERVVVTRDFLNDPESFLNGP